MPLRTFALPALLTAILALAALAGPPARTDRHGDALPVGAVMRLGSLRFCQPFPSTIAFSPDGKLLASGGADGCVRLWDPDTGKEVRVLEGHKDSVNGIAFSADGKWLASGGQDDDLCLWEAATGKERRRIRGHKAPIERLALSPDGKVLASSCLAGTLRLWDTDTGRQIRSLPIDPGYRVLAMTFTPDSKCLAFNNVYTQGIQLVDVATGKRVLAFRGHNGNVDELAFSADGRRLYSAGSDHTIRLWDVASGKELRRFGDRKMHVRCLALSPDEKTLTYGTYPDGLVHIHDIATDKDLIQPWKANPWCVVSITYSPDGKKVAVGRDLIAIHETATGKRLNPPADSEGRVQRIDYAPDGKWLAVWRYEDPIEVWDTASWRRTATLRADIGRFSSMAFSPDGKHLTTTEGSFKQGSVSHWDPRSGKRLRDFPQGEGWLGSLCYSADGKTLAWIHTRGKKTLVLADSADGKERLRIVDTEYGRGLCLCPDGTVLASDGIMTPVTLWDTRTGKPLRQLGKPGSHAPGLFGFSPDGRTLAMREGNGAGGFLPDVVLWETATGRERLRLAMKEGPLSDAVFLPNGRLLAAVGRSEAILLWDTDTGKEAGRLRGHRGWINSLSFAPDGKTLVSGGADATVLVWDVSGLKSGKKLSLRLGRDELARCWDDLAGTDAARAYQAVTRLGRCRGQAEGLLEARLGGHPGLSAERVARLIADLDADDFKVREKASAELAHLGPLAEGALTRALDEAPSAEAQRRIRALLGKLKTGADSLERVRLLRAIEVLDRLGTPQARRLLAKLQKEATATEVIEAAKRALRRAEKGRRMRLDVPGLWTSVIRQSAPGALRRCRERPPWRSAKVPGMNRADQGRSAERRGGRSLQRPLVL
jgi:WD40 repeat protein